MFWAPKESGFLMEQIGVKMTLKEESGKSQTAKNAIIQGDRSLDALSSMFWTTKELGYQMEPIGVKDDLRRGIKTAKKVTLDGDGSLNALFSSSCEKFKVFSTPKESEYLMEPIGFKGDLRRGIREVRTGQKAM